MSCQHHQLEQETVLAQAIGGTNFLMLKLPAEWLR
jgi:hypothetical protein